MMREGKFCAGLAIGAIISVAVKIEPTPGTLDAAYDMSESHFQSLYPSLVLQRPVGATLGEALEHLLDQALAHQYPKHPKFGQEIKFGKDLRQVTRTGVNRFPNWSR